MKIESIIGNLSLKEFKKEYIDRSKTLLIKDTEFHKEFDLKKVEDFVKNPQNACHLRRLNNGTFVPMTESAEFYSKIQSLEGDDLWREFCRGVFSLQIVGLNKCFPEIKNINSQLYKELNTGTQNYLVISHGIEKSSYKDHADPADLFAIQLQGSKIWNTPLNDKGENLISHNLELPYNPQSKEDVQFKRFELCPGDIVYIPFMLPHFIEIEKPQETSIHIVLGLTCNYFELIQKDFLSKIKEKADILPAFQPVDQSQTATVEIIKKMKSEIINHLEALSEEEFASKYLNHLNHFEVLRTLNG